MSTVFKLKRSSVKGKAPTTSNIELGEIAINTNDGRLFFKTTDSSSSSAIVTLREISAGTGMTQTGGELKITDTGVVSGSYGSATEIPILSINAQGQIDSASTISVAGVSGLAYDSDTNLLTLSTADGGSYSVKIDLSSFTDSDTTDDLPEGSTNQYFTNARVQTHLGAVTGSIIPDTDSAYDLGSPSNKFRDLYLSNNSIFLGGIKIQADEANNRLVVADSQGNTNNFSYDLGQNTTDDLPEGTSNLYYDSAAVVTASRSALSAGSGGVTYNPQTGVIGFTAGVYAGFDSDFSQKTTNDLTEGGSNLYFTNTRARGAVSGTNSGTGYGSLGYNSGTGAFTFTKVTDADIRGRFSQGSGISYNSSTGVISSSITQYTDADARGAVSATDGGGDGSFSYDSSTGIFTYTGPSASEVRAHFSQGTGINISGGQISTTITQYADSDARVSISVTDAGGDGSLSYDNSTGIITYTGPSASESRAHFSAGGDLSYDSGTGRFSFTERTDAEVRGLVSHSDAGGDGSFSYNSSTGVFTYTGPSASETRAHFSGGTGVTLTNGEFAIGQSVGTTDDVTFGKVTADSAALDNIVLTRRTSAPRPDASLVGGELFFDSDPSKGLTFIPRTHEGNTDVALNIGQEEVVYIFNDLGETINNGEVVRFVGAHSDGSPKVEKTLASSPIDGPIGVATQDIPDNAHGYITTQGLVRGFDTIRQTLGGPFSAGDRAYICNVNAGGFVKHDIGPDSGYPFQLGTIIVADSNDGVLFINPVREHWTRARFSGKVKTSGDLQADGDVTARSIKFDGTVPEYAEGELFYDSANGAIAFKNDVEGITMQIGQEDWVRVYNNSGSQINNGQPVHINGSMANTPTIELADATDAEKVYTIGLATHNIANGSYGYVTTKGVVNDVDTSAFTAGSKVHVGTTAGTLQAAAPTFPNYAIDIGYVLTVDSSAGSILVSIVDHTFEVTRTTGDARVDGNLTVAGNVNILGTETKTAVQSLSVGDAFIYVGAGDTITTVFGTGQSGLNDMTFKEYYEGDSDKTYFVKITATDSAGAGGDTIQWGFDSADGIGEFTPLSFDSDGGTGPTSHRLGTDRTLIPLRYNIKATFAAAEGHTVGNYWKGSASPVNQDIGFFGNYNTADQPYSHSGIYRDIDDKRWKFVGRYDPEPDGNINTGHSSFEYAEVQATRFHGAVTGDVTGNASTATLLENSRTIGISGEVSGTGVSFNGSQDITISGTTVGSGVIDNDNIASNAAIADSKLDTISTAGKVQNGATTATSANTANAIVARDVSGNFTAGTITANLTGNVTGTVSSLSNQTSTIRGLFSVDDTLSYDSSTGQFSITNPGTDSATTHAIFSVDSSANTGDGSLTYNGAGVFTYVGPSAAETRAHFSEGTGISISNGQISTSITQYTDADARGAVSGGNTGTGHGSLGYNSTTGAFTFTKVTNANIRSAISEGTGISISNGEISTTITQYADADARGAISHTNTGTGFGSIGYNSSTGVINYNKVTNTNIRSVLSAGGDLSYDSSSGQFSFDETYSTANELLTAIKTVDGASSNLDADKLDGQEGSHYRINVYNSSGTLLN